MYHNMYIDLAINMLNWQHCSGSSKGFYTPSTWSLSLSVSFSLSLCLSVAGVAHSYLAWAVLFLCA